MLDGGHCGKKHAEKIASSPLPLLLCHHQFYPVPLQPPLLPLRIPPLKPRIPPLPRLNLPLPIPTVTTVPTVPIPTPQRLRRGFISMHRHGVKLQSTKTSNGAATTATKTVGPGSAVMAKKWVHLGDVGTEKDRQDELTDEKTDLPIIDRRREKYVSLYYQCSYLLP